MRCAGCVQGSDESPHEAAGERRRQDRIQRGLRLREEAKRLGVSPRLLSDVENGKVSEEEAGLK